MKVSMLSLTLLALVACGTPDASVTVEDPTPCAVPGLPNCRQTGDVVFAGQPEPAALEYLASQGYATVVSTRGMNELSWDERAAVESLGMRFVQIPMESPVTGITAEQIAALDSVLAGHAGPILLHCGSGNRVAGLWAAWLAEKQGMDPDEALRLAQLAGMTRVRPVVEARLAGGDR